MKKYWYIVGVLVLALGMSYTTYQYFTPMLKVADESTQISVMQDFWQFLLLGFVIGGVFFAIPGNNSRIRIGASLCILASCVFFVFLGAGISAVDSWFRYPIMAIIQIGITSFYAGIAIVMIDLLAEVPKAIRKEIGNL